jgi:hypothetical protein
MENSVDKLNDVYVTLSASANETVREVRKSKFHSSFFF